MLHSQGKVDHKHPGASGRHSAKNEEKMSPREYRRNLLDAVMQSTNCTAIHTHTQPVRLYLNYQVAWKGKVEVFQLKDHSQAKVAFAWGVKNDEHHKKMHYVIVLGIPPLDTPLMAVKAYVATHT